MNLNLRELSAKAKPLEWAERLEVADLLRANRDVLKSGALTADLRADMAGDIAEVAGTLKLALTMQCSRCLEPFQTELTLPFEAFFTANPANAREAADEDLEDEDIHLCPDGQVDLTPYLQEAVLLGLPYVPVCRDGCRGLCPVCGANRNEHECGCKQERVDPRLAGLKELFDS